MPLGLTIRNAKKKQIEEMRNKKICTYCGTGYRGNIAADELNKEGFNAVTLEGGYSSWSQSQFLHLHVFHKYIQHKYCFDQKQDLDSSTFGTDS